MTGSIHKAAFQAEQPPPAEAITTDPTARLEAMYRRIWANSMRDLPFVNPALSVEAVGFRRWQSVGALRLATASSPVDQSELIDRPLLSASGDWLGTVITPWFVNLFLVPGGGNLWSDRRPGERCHVQFPIGPLEFIADHDASAEIPSYQYCALFAPPGQFTSQAAARAAAVAALTTLLATAPPVEARVQPAPSSAVKPGTSRRAFFRRIARG
ncbi:conserved hypothetical protein [Candidatus Accumulibacter aalborgensis]|uniref:Uncharacterized protein n=1 Tax=Candidatus Accumulibacter aalborgensis TaxID=1860102 RepID=A0A1A8XF42_9PROT|nr:[NiFe]-hydrogenase assembly chaperone HybE [Candidatus Accumulibacter aalborgensis]SBT03790.1 conserved hypothetical protein [Candidatus Accumulibacter aalborgensis]